VRAIALAVWSFAPEALRSSPRVVRVLWEVGIWALVYLAYESGHQVAWLCRDSAYWVFVVCALPVCVIFYFLILQWINLKKEYGR